MRRLLEVFRSPSTTFLLVAGVVGLLVVFLVPTFAGIDEGSHFVRAYQISDGTLVPRSPVRGAPPGGGACVPASVIGGIKRASAPYEVHLLEGKAQFAKLVQAARAREHASDATLAAPYVTCEGDEHFFSLATFAWYSPVPYLPQAFGVGVVRLFGGGVPGMLLAARLACLLAYVGIAWVAIRRSPVGRWALCITALLPVALFEGATSVSPDAMTTAVALLVISSALRMTASKSPRLPRAFLVEALILSVWLGLCKPSYVIVALCYLLPLLGPARRWSYWPLGIAIAAGVGVSALWQTRQKDLFVCDTGAFGAVLDPSKQRELLRSNPFRLVGAGCRAALDYGDKWAGDMVSVGDRVVNWPLVVGVIIAAVFLFLAIQRDPKERLELHWQQRVWVLLVFVAAYFAVIAGWVIYCESPPIHVGIPPHVRLFLPALALLPLALELPRDKLKRLSVANVPLSIVLVPFYVIWLIALVSLMR